jgi:putative membrane protein
MLINFLSVVVTMMVAAQYVPGVQVDSLFSAAIAAIILGLVNSTLRPLLLLLTLPITIVTVGLFSLVVNALMVQVVSLVVKGFTIDDFRAALFLAILLLVVRWTVDALRKE